MKKALIVIGLLMISFFLFSQKEDAVWLLGGGSERTFDGPQALNECRFSDTIEYEKKKINFAFDMSNASVCDSNGNLICYTNGTFLHNGNHELIENGGEFQDSTYRWGFNIPQGTLLLPVPEKQGIYLFISCDRFSYRRNDIKVGAIKPLHYSLIDMNENNGAGKVREKRLTINTDTLAPGQLTAVRHGNGRDWWILTSKYETNKYYRYLLDPKGIQLVGTQEVGDTIKTSLGQSVFSPDGNWYARYNWYGVTQINDRKRVDIYKFDRCTGLLSEHKYEDLPGENGAPGGIAFSENSQFLYASGWDTIYQYDMAVTDILTSRTKVAEYDGFIGRYGVGLRFFAMQLAPNGKIYICIPNINSHYLHTIENPNEKGLACNVNQHSVEFPFSNYFSIPNIPYFRLGKWEDSPCDTIGISSVEYFSILQEIQLFPNPSNGEVNITIPEIKEDLKLKIFDSSGSVFSELTLKKGKFNYDFQLPPGLFIYSIQDQFKRRLKTGKIVVIE